MLLSFASAALAPQRTPLAAASVKQQASTQQQSEFSRSRDLLQISGEKVSARQVANVLGRWKTGREWNNAGVGRKGLLDDFRNGDYYDEDVKQLQTDFSQPMDREYFRIRSHLAAACYERVFESQILAEYIARRPQFLDFCERYSLLPRWVHRESVGRLPFADDEAGRALAASVGATVEELNKEPVDDLAADVVFDALSMTGMTGFVNEEECDLRRASFHTADGGFDAENFGSSLGRSRRNLLGVLILGPGVFLLGLVSVAIHFLPQILESSDAFSAKIERNMQLGGPFACIIPAAVFALAGRSAKFVPSWQRQEGGGTSGSILNSGGVKSKGKGKAASAEGKEEPSAAQPLVLNYQQRATKRRDELYLERMKRKRRGEDDVVRAPMPEEMSAEEYFEKMWKNGGGIRIPLLDKLMGGKE